MGYFTYQIKEDACALACFRMILVNETGKMRYRDAKLEKHPPNSLSDLEEGAKRYGHALSFYEAEKKEINYPFSKKQGFLATLGDRKNGHMVYVRKIKKGAVYYYDPAIGKCKKKKAEFERMWTGVFGILEKGSSIAYPPKKAIINPVKRALLTLLSLVSEGSLLAGLAFFYQEGNILLPVLSFVIFGLLSVVNRIITLRTNRELDETTLGKIYRDDSKEMIQLYKQYHIYKRYALNGIPDSICAGCVALAFTILIAINNPFFLLPVFLMILGYLGFGAMIKNRVSRKENVLENLENSLSKKQSKEEITSSLKTIGTLSSSLASEIEYGRIVLTVGLLSSNLLSLLGEKEITLNFYLFHLFSLLAVFLLSKKGIDFLNDRREYEVAKGYFQEYLLDN